MAVDVVTKEASYVPMEILLKEDLSPKLQKIALRQVASVSKVGCLEYNKNIAGIESVPYLNLLHAHY